MKIEIFLKEGPTKSVSNYGEICIDEVVGAMKNNGVVALEEKTTQLLYLNKIFLT